MGITARQIGTVSPALSALSAVGVLLFLAVVGLIHVAQPEYDWHHQFMSELALGRWGGSLLLAFLGLAMAAAATAVNVWCHQYSPLLAILLGFAALCFVGAGLITLGDSAQIHVALVAVAFVACGVAMYLLPRTVAALSGRSSYAVSWGACLIMCGATGLGNSLMLGVAQRISALALLFWLLFLAWCLRR